MNRLCYVNKGVNKVPVGAQIRKEPRSTSAIHVLSVGSMECGSKVHDALLVEPSLRLTIATDSQELWVIPKEDPIQVAILDHTLREFELEDTSLFIRVRWPLARILLVRSDEGPLDCALYDDCVTPTVTQELLLSTIERLAAGCNEWGGKYAAL